MSLSSEELLEIRLALKGAAEAKAGLEGTAKATKEVGSAATSTGSASTKAEKSTSRLSKAYGALGKAARWGIGFLGVGAVFAIHSAIQKTEDLAKTTAGLTRNFHLNTKVASRWGAVAQARDIDSKALTMSFGTLSSKLTEAARKGGTALTPFRQLGLTQADAAKGAGNFQWGIMRVAQALGDATGGAKRMTAAKALLGKGFQTILPLFSKGTKSLKEQLHWADKYGVTLDGKTNKSLMGLVNAQRESKVAMLGLQIAMTKALLPAIKGGDDQLQKFIATLNDPKLSGDQKIARIEKQFQDLEDRLIQVIADALPKVAEQGGTLGLKLGWAVWRGFKNSGLLGKLFIGYWVFRFMGGPAITTLSGKIGGRIATSLGRRFLAVVAPYFAAEGMLGNALNTKMAGLSPLMRRWGGRLGVALAIGFVTFGLADARTRNSIIRFGNKIGTWIVDGLKWTINKGIDAINAVINRSIDIGPVHIHGPKLGHVGSLNGLIQGAGPIGGSATGVIGQGGSFGTTPTPRHHPHHRAGAKRPRPQRMPRRAVMGGGAPIVLHNVIELDGKVAAESTTHYAANAAALA